MTARWTVRARLLWTFGALAAMVATVSAIAVHALTTESRRHIGFFDGINTRFIVAEELRSAVDDRAIAARNLLLVRPTEIEGEHRAVQKAHALATQKLGQLLGLVDNASDASPQAKQLVHAIQAVENAYGPVALAIVDLSMQGRRDEAMRKMDIERRPLLAKLQTAIDEYSAYTAAAESLGHREAANPRTRSRRWRRSRRAALARLRSSGHSARGLQEQAETLRASSACSGSTPLPAPSRHA